MLIKLDFEHGKLAKRIRTVFDNKVAALIDEVIEDSFRSPDIYDMPGTTSELETLEVKYPAYSHIRAYVTRLLKAYDLEAKVNECIKKHVDRMIETTTIEALEKHVKDIIKRAKKTTKGK